MTLANLHSSDGPGGGPLLLWSAAVLAALAAHAGLAAWVMRNPPVVPAEAAAPAAVMLELAPASPELAEPEISEQSFDAPEIAAPQHEPVTSPAPAAPAEPLPTPTLPDLLAAPATDAAPAMEMPPVPVPDAEVALARPVARPADLPRMEPPEPEPQPQRAERVPEREPVREPTREPPSQAARRAAAEAPPAEAAAASQASRGSSGSVTPAQWQSRLMAHLERRKRYPPASRARREEGVALVRFAIDAQGNVTSVRIARSSGHAALDDEVVALVRRASPVPAPPPDAPRDITAPFQFRIR